MICFINVSNNYSNKIILIGMYLGMKIKHNKLIGYVKITKNKRFRCYSKQPKMVGCEWAYFKAYCVGANFCDA